MEVLCQHSKTTKLGKEAVLHACKMAKLEK